MLRWPSMDVRLDGSPMIEVRGEHWCCLLCMRQFKSEKQVLKHLDKSTLHAENLLAAVNAGRICEAKPDGAKEERAKKRERDHELDRDSAESFTSSAEPAASTAATTASSSSRLSALEQMELFEKRLKVEATRQPDKPEAAPSGEAQVDSTRARSINRQMDWECSGCAMVNFGASPPPSPPPSPPS